MALFDAAFCYSSMVFYFFEKSLCHKTCLTKTRRITKSFFEMDKNLRRSSIWHFFLEKKIVDSRCPQPYSVSAQQFNYRPALHCTVLGYIYFTHTVQLWLSTGTALQFKFTTSKLTGVIRVNSTIRCSKQILDLKHKIGGIYRTELNSTRSVSNMSHAVLVYITAVAANGARQR